MHSLVTWSLTPQKEGWLETLWIAIENGNRAVAIATSRNPDNLGILLFKNGNCEVAIHKAVRQEHGRQSPEATQAGKNSPDRVRTAIIQWTMGRSPLNPFAYLINL